MVFIEAFRTAFPMLIGCEFRSNNQKPETMNQKPTFTFALSPGGAELTPQIDLWSEPVPGSRLDVGRQPEDRTVEQSLTYGGYFTAARDFLSKDRCARLCEAAGKLTGKAVAPEDIRQVSVYLVKFGAFYHPAYVVAEVGERNLSLVLNVAVSSKGRRMIVREYQILSHLNARYDAAYWPRVFGLGEGLDADGRPIPMFLGQWLEGFYEFHLSGETSEQRHMVVWDTQRGHLRLTHEQVLSCLRQAAGILTYIYNPLTFESVRHWHHAAGDFVVAHNDDEVVLRLITMREYAPIVENPEPDVAAMLEGLLIFLVEISMKLRLDRLDGIGRMVCHDRHAVPAICDGFFQGLASAAPAYGLPEDFDETVRAFFALHDTEQLHSIASSVLKNTSIESGERDLLERKMKRHLAALLNAIQS